MVDVGVISGFIAGLGIGLSVTFFIGSKSSENQTKQNSDDEWEDMDSDEDTSSAWNTSPPSAFVTNSNKPAKLVLVVRNDLKMGKGKVAAQCSHATLDAYKIASKKCPKILQVWERRGQPKIVTKVETEDDLLEIYATALSLGVVASVIQDAGHTQVAPGSRTVVAIGPGPEDLVNQITGKLKLY